MQYKPFHNISTAPQCLAKQIKRYPSIFGGCPRIARAPRVDDRVNNVCSINYASWNMQSRQHWIWHICVSPWFSDATPLFRGLETTCFTRCFTMLYNQLDMNKSAHTNMEMVQCSKLLYCEADYDIQYLQFVTYLKKTQYW